jgi:hypothetical protein
VVINDPHRSTLPDGFRVADYTAEGSGHSRTCTTTLGQRLRDLRESRNLTQYQVAALLGRPCSVTKSLVATQGESARGNVASTCPT